MKVEKQKNGLACIFCGKLVTVKTFKNEKCEHCGESILAKNYKIGRIVMPKRFKRVYVKKAK